MTLGLAELTASYPTPQHADRKVVDHHIGGFAQLLADRPALVPGHVQRQRTLVAVPHEVVSAVRAIGAGAHRRVDLDDVGTEIAEDARGERAGKYVREVQDAQALERAWVRGGGR